VQFLDGAFEGLGAETFADGMYVGSFHSGLRHGLGANLCPSYSQQLQCASFEPLSTSFFTLVVLLLPATLCTTHCVLPQSMLGPLAISLFSSLTVGARYPPLFVISHKFRLLHQLFYHS